MEKSPDATLGGSCDNGSAAAERPIPEKVEVEQRSINLFDIEHTDALFTEVDGDWQRLAVCAQTDPEAFFPDKGGSTREAKRVCKRCPVTDQCLEFALLNDERFGIWGGLSERERRQLKKRLG